MIGRQEILEFAGEVGLDPNVVEKDYLLGWMLAGIAQHPQTRDTWVFKGGTCLKKCYFETYRFSEDLDFTLLDGSHVDETVLRGLFVEITEWIYDQSGIEFPEEARLFEVYRNPRGKKSGHSRIGYRGPMGRSAIRRAAESARLVADTGQTAGSERGQAREQSRNQRLQGLDAIVPCNQHHHGDRQRGKVLLVLQVLIGGDEHVEVFRRAPQQLAVADSGAADFGHRLDGVPGQIIAQFAR